MEDITSYDVGICNAILFIRGPSLTKIFIEKKVNDNRLQVLALQIMAEIVQSVHKTTRWDCEMKEVVLLSLETLSVREHVFTYGTAPSVHGQY